MPKIATTGENKKNAPTHNVQRPTMMAQSRSFHMSWHGKKLNYPTLRTKSMEGKGLYGVDRNSYKGVGPKNQPKIWCGQVANNPLGKFQRF